jgi:hypothetical protein
MRTMLRVALGCSTSLLLAACAKSDQAKTDSAAGAAAAAPAAAAPAPAPAPAPAIALAHVAGKWQIRSVPESGTDTSATTYVLTATADSTWTMTFPSGLKVPVHVMASGDSVIEKTGSFASQRRKGVKVTMTEGSFKLQNGKLVGTTTAHYAKPGPDSVLRMHAEGTKMP